MSPTIGFNKRFKHVTLYSRKIECESLNELESLCTCGFTPAIKKIKVKHIFPFFKVYLVNVYKCMLYRDFIMGIV